MGYTIDDEQYYQMDPLTALIVQDVFTRYAEGSTVQEIANYLNNKGILSARNRKNHHQHRFPHA